MKIKNLYIISFITVAFGASAQTLSTEVVVDRNIVPEEKTASRPSWLIPSLVLPEVTMPVINPITYNAVSVFPRSYKVLAPIYGAFAAEKSPYRGYLSVGYFPTLDFGVNAGYRIVDKDMVTFGIRANFDSERYRPYGGDGDMNRQYFATGSVALDFSWRPRKNSCLSANAGYTYLREKTTYWQPQNTNSGNLGVGWKSLAGDIYYSGNVSARFEHASDTYLYLTEVGNSPLIPGRSQTVTDFSVEGHKKFGVSSFGLSVDGDFIHTSVSEHATLGAFDITPRYSYAVDKFKADVGVKLDFGTGKSSHWGGVGAAFGVMPDIHLDFKPFKALGIWADITGGSHLNSFDELRQESVYQIFPNPFGRSRIPVAIDAAVNVGPFKGAFISFFGGYALADKWLMASNSALAGFAPVDISGWHAGVKVGAQWRFIKADVSADFAPSSYDKAWYMRRDRSAAVISASLEVKPLSPLTVTLDYEFRNKRRAYDDSRFFVDLGCVSDLSLGAEWMFSPAFSAFCRLQNILCRRYMMIPWEPSRKLNGLFGIAYKF